MATPRRMRGYYRAVKRKEPWAMAIDCKKGLAWSFAYYFRDIDWAEQLKRPSIFDQMAKSDDCWQGGYLSVPIKIKLEWGKE